ncbi:MAG: hypothetical protein IJX01_07315 [Oscillospiraceae bacterium]|nr:hypothetical protein [Oscillospiraceae bacterium]
MLYINQRDYPDMPYPNNVAGACRPESQNIAKAGCGVCSACMVVDQLTTQSLGLEDCVQLSVDSKANLEPGTDMKILGTALAEKYNFKFSYGADKEAMLACLRRGGRVIVNVANRPDGSPGLFTKTGHYMVLIAADGERICFLDPYYGLEYNEGELKEKVDSSRAPLLYCDLDLLERETENRKIKYYLFERA